MKKIKEKKDSIIYKILFLNNLNIIITSILISIILTVFVFDSMEKNIQLETENSIKAFNSMYKSILEDLSIDAKKISKERETIRAVMDNKVRYDRPFIENVLTNEIYYIYKDIKQNRKFEFKRMAMAKAEEYYGFKMGSDSDGKFISYLDENGNPLGESIQGGINKEFKVNSKNIMIEKILKDSNVFNNSKMDMYYGTEFSKNGIVLRGGYPVMSISDTAGMILISWVPSDKFIVDIKTSMKSKKDMTHFITFENKVLMGEPDNSIFKMGEEVISQKEYNNKVRNLKEAEFTIVQKKINKLSYYIGLYPVRDVNGEIIGTLGIANPTNELEKSRISIFLIIIGITIGVIILNSIFGTYFSYIIVKPIRVLTETAKEIAEGNYDKEFNVTGSSEVLRLSSSLKEMLEKIKKYQKGMQEKNTELINTVEQLQMTQQQLVMSEKMASAGRLAGGIAHELNSPLGAVLTSVQLLKSDIVSIQDNLIKSEIEGSIDIIEDGTKKAREIISQFLKITSRSEEKLENIKLFDLVCSAVKMSEKLLEQNEISLDLSIEETLYVYGNKLELVQVFINVISNSIEAILLKNNKNGEILVKAYTNSNEKLIIEIIDNGIGIKDDIINKIFEPFFTTKQIGKGLGLGLTISYDILKKHKAEMKIVSEQTKGTIVKIEFL